MALTVGTKTNSTIAGGGATNMSFSHIQDVGSNPLLTVNIGHSIASPNVSGVSYNGTPMTRKYLHPTATTEINVEAWELANPDTGSNTVLVDFSGAQFNPVSTEAISFVGAEPTIGNELFIDTVGPPASGNITVSQNSMVVAVGVAGTVGTDITIDGSSRTIDWNDNINNYYFGGVSNSGLSAGSIDVSANSSASVALFAYEVKEAIAPPTETSRNTQAVWL